MIILLRVNCKSILSMVATVPCMVLPTIGTVYRTESEDDVKKIRIGTLVSMNDPEEGLRRLDVFLKYGFESFSLTFWKSLGEVDLAALARRVREKLDPAKVSVSCLSIFGNPLAGDAGASDAISGWERLIDAAGDFGCDMVTGFTGRVRGRPLPESIPEYARVFGPLARRAEANGVRLAFENCAMGGNWSSGDWNIAVDPAAWRLMFDALPNANLGLEWEPCHQLVRLIDPVPQLREWAPRVFHVHGKDATVDRHLLATYGTGGAQPYAWHRTPGFGDSNWSDILTILLMAGYEGTVDIEGYHDPVFKGELELSGQVAALEYLKRCRGGSVDEAL